jgi:hypothetical protein
MIPRFNKPGWGLLETSGLFSPCLAGGFFSIMADRND